MGAEFWGGAIRDLCLLVAGGALTLLGGWLSNRQSSKRAEIAREHELADAKDAHATASLEAARSAIFNLYVEARDQEKRGERVRIQLDDAAMLEAESRGYLIPDRELRELVQGATGAVRGVGAAVQAGRIVGDPVKLQIQVLFGSLRLLSARLRGDPLDQPTAAAIRHISEQTAATWVDLIKRGGAEPA